ncbi:MAG: hypothetical protein V7K50_21355 [Nostoc sp.]
MERLEGTNIGTIFRLNGGTGMIGQALQINPKLVQMYSDKLNSVETN